MLIVALAALLFLLLPIMAMVFVDYAFGKWGGVDNRNYLSGTQVADRIKLAEPLTPVIEATTVSDHYDPAQHAIRLTDKIAHQPSVLAMAVTAHELGHAQQHEENSGLIQLRSVLVPALQIAPTLSYGLITAGVVLRQVRVIWVGVAMFMLIVLFMFLTLPIEVDASRRGMALLEKSGLLEDERDKRGARQVLVAAALTYVSASVLSIGQLLRYIRLARLG